MSNQCPECGKKHKKSPKLYKCWNQARWGYEMDLIRWFQLEIPEEEAKMVALRKLRRDAMLDYFNSVNEG